MEHDAASPLINAKVPPPSMPAAGTHKYTLYPEALQRGTARSGGTLSLMRKLEHREPISIGVVGASVAQNGGCLTQPGNRCIEKDGVHPTKMVHGEVRLRPHKGFLVRWFEFLNNTWPPRHGRHSLHNGARDANSLSPIIPCLFSHLPPQPDVVIVEALSLYRHQDIAVIESLVRQVLC